MASFRGNTSVRRVPQILLCVLLAATLWLTSGCQLLFTGDNHSAISSSGKKDRGSDDKDKTEKSVEIEPDETEDKSDTKNQENEPERTVYTMDLTLDTDAHSIGGSVTIDVVNTSDDDWAVLCFRDYPSLFTSDNDFTNPLDGKISRISNVRDEDNNEELEMERAEEDVSVIFIEMKKPVKPNETRRISMDFVSYVPELADRFGYMDDTYNLSNFYPVLAVYEDGAWVAHPYVYMGECFYSLVSDYYLTFHIPSDMILACSGEETQHENGEWSAEALMVRDISVVAAEGYEVLTDEIDGIKVNCYYTEDKKWAEDAVDAGIRAIGAFNDAFGPYPYPEIDIMQTALFAGGMEYPSIVLIYKDFEASSDPNSTLAIVIAHEIAHQWFYSLVGNDQYDEAWLDESFASYAEYVYMETYMDEDDLENHLYWSKERVGGEDFEGMEDNLRLNIPYNEFVDEEFYIIVAYDYGSAFLYCLREEMGDEDFTAMMKAYVKEFSHKIATSDDFVEYVQIYAGDNQAVENLLSIFLPGVE